MAQEVSPLGLQLDPGAIPSIFGLKVLRGKAAGEVVA